MAKQIDVLVAGAGYVGLATAVSIKNAAPHLKVEVVDLAPEGIWEKDGRASAIAAAAGRMLDQLECWEALIPHAEAIKDMIVTDSKTQDPVRPVFLTFGNAEEDDGNGPFAHMVPNREMSRALRKKAKALKLPITQGVGVSAFARHNERTSITLSDGSERVAKLLVACDGVRSKLRDMAGIKTVHVDYGQVGIVATIAHERPHHGRAEEHFLPAGPFATLPLKDNRSSIVWTESTRDAERLIAADPFVQEAELEQRFGLHLGNLTIETPLKGYPLGLTLAREFVRDGFVLAGDAAHGIHPIAGQGLNLGFKDAAALAEVIVEADRLGLDIGNLTVLERYQQWRRFDTVQMGVTTDVLNRLFSNDFGPLRAIRSLGLGLVDRMPRMKDYFIAQASGKQPNAPRLLQGEAI